METVLLLILLMPLLGFIVLGAGFRIIPAKWTSFAGPGTVLVSFILSLIVFTGLPNSSSFHFHYFDWLRIGSFIIPFDLLADPLSLLMMLIVTGVGFIIHVYSVGYMGHNKGFNRFFAYMNLFIFFMLLLVMGGNYVVLFAGWEGVGLCSYLLIGFWFRNNEFNYAARKAFVMNRIGDLGFLLGMFLIFTTFGSFSYPDVFEQARVMGPGNPVIIAITLLLFIGAAGKSAQIPLYTWLPDAMAGPTPVSALIHAATMVTAGIYMTARSGVLYMLAPLSLEIIGVVALATMLLSACIAIFQDDIKKVLAYSTISQLGYMFLALSTGAFTAAMFHLTTHAFFKALLFLAAGSVIHALEGEQDIRKMGGLRKALPRTWYTFMAGTLAIAGLPPFSGFFSKDEILASAFTAGLPWWLPAVAVSMMTAFYMFRLLFLVFEGKFRGNRGGSESTSSSADSLKKIHESPPVMTVPLIILALLSLAGGFINIPEILGGSGLLKEYLAPVFADALNLRQGAAPAAGHWLEWANMGIVLVLVLLTAWFAFRKFVTGNVMEGEGKPATGFVRWAVHRFYIDELYDNVIVKPVLKFSDGLRDLVEIKTIDRVVEGTGALTDRLSRIFRYLQTGHTGTYLFFMVTGILLILFFNIIL